MKYIVRAVKYFLYIIILLVLMMVILILLKVVDADISTMFRNGYDSLWQIALMFACVAAVYPTFGYMKKETLLPGEFAQLRPGILDYMQLRGYELEKEEGENMTFRLRGVAGRITRMLEDRITFKRVFGGYELEGLRRDVVRLGYGLEHKFRKEEE